MKILFSISLLFLAVMPRSLEGLDAQEHAVRPAQLLLRADAEAILGEVAMLEDSGRASANGAFTYRCTYAPTSEQTDGRTGRLYFLYEEYEKLALAEKKYSVTRTANEDNGIIILEGVGNEAYFHTDNSNFYFIMVRKGNRIISMKVNKITSTTSLDDFHRVAKKITGAL